MKLSISVLSIIQNLNKSEAHIKINKPLFISQTLLLYKLLVNSNLYDFDSIQNMELLRALLVEVSVQEILKIVIGVIPPQMERRTEASGEHWIQSYWDPVPFSQVEMEQILQDSGKDSRAICKDLNIFFDHYFVPQTFSAMGWKSLILNSNPQLSKTPFVNELEYYITNLKLVGSGILTRNTVSYVQSYLVDFMYHLRF